MFKRTVLSLTLQYSVLLLVTFAVFAGGIYFYTVHTFDHDNNDYSDSNSSSSVVQDVTDKDVSDLRAVLFLSYGTLVILVPILSYNLAGRALRPIAESYAAQQRFVGNASHELRTPLSVIQGELELAVSKLRKRKEYEAAIHTSLEEVENLSHLVQNLLLLAQNDYERLRSQFALIQLRPLIEQVTEKARKAYSHEAPLITLHVPSSLQVNGSTELIESALTNVLDNAMKYTSPTGKVHVRAQATAHAVIIVVSDTGSGIEPTSLPRVFDYFWRAEAARPIKGYGLGLSLTRHIMRIHKGNVTVRSTDKGTTVELSFPLIT